MVLSYYLHLLFMAIKFYLGNINQLVDDADCKLDDNKAKCIEDATSGCLINC